MWKFVVFKPPAGAYPAAGVQVRHPHIKNKKTNMKRTGGNFVFMCNLLLFRKERSGIDYIDL